MFGDEGPKIYKRIYCPEGWTAFKRASGTRCLKIFLSEPIPQLHAEMQCRKHSALLSGLENRAEGQWINSQFLPHRPNVPGFKTVWIGAKRKLQCWKYNRYSPECFPKSSRMFAWTDGSVTGTQEFGPWWDNNPSNGGGVGPIQPCIMLTIQSEPVGNNKYRSTPGSLDDVQCEGFQDNIMGYVCSKAAIKE